MDRRVKWAVVAGVLLVLGAVFFSDRVQEQFRPTPVQAHVAIQVEGESVARVGRVEIDVGIRFKLHAVLEAEERSGERLFFTRAPALEVDGELIAATALRPWDGSQEARVLWFSVEGPRPLVALEELGQFTLQENYRSDWPLGWSIPGSLQPARDRRAEEERALRGAPFGTQRFMVRIELFGPASKLVPVASFSSLGAAQLAAAADRFPTVVATLPGRLQLPSRVFGLTQIKSAAGGWEAGGSVLRTWFDQDLAFSRPLLLRAMMDRAETSWDALQWQGTDLAAGPGWSEEGVVGGDLLRVGERVVVLFDDRGTPGLLDYQDLGLDFLEGAQVRRLAEVFSGDGLVEHAPLRWAPQ